MKAPLESRRFDPENWPMLVLFVLLHLACFAAIWTGVHWRDIALCLALYALRMFGVTAGYHRYFAHRAYKAGRVMQFFLAALAQSSLQSGALWWAAKHRDHHKYSDTELDAHSPRQHGFWFSHMGWIFNKQAAAADYERIPEFMAYPELRWLNRHHWVPGTILGLSVWLIGGWSALVVGFIWSTVLLWHATFCINSLVHVFGRQRYLTGDDSRNNWLFALLSLGEGWHNNHHYYMASARQGFYWWEVDITYYTLRGLERLGLVSELRDPPAHVLAGTRAVSAEIKERLARELARRFDAERVVRRMQKRWVELNREHRLGEWRQQWAEQLASRREQLAAVVHAELPSLDQLYRQARRRFARTPALEEVVARARELLAQSVMARLETVPVRA
ncbi:stearoyl-CoA desaturase (delta-9 desaturase) [Solimonas aquatica]|uniref:Stearoyl-CoA desaturase (Delta-9 desaturase) n=1 Tax=Solimonas aquatica TaxID=489703 RepID=A0A1H9JWJ3_9GAMM|nr:fatty acid desaturase [Solimonas aquatica]SEQ91134.1 stearoyl-CoA desaturase (delta-9 desaturase) [Solimonas aquatica]